MGYINIPLLGSTGTEVLVAAVLYGLGWGRLAGDCTASSLKLPAAAWEFGHGNEGETRPCSWKV